MYNSIGEGDIIFYGSNNQINIGKNPTFNDFHLEIHGDNININIGDNVTFNKVYAVFSGNEKSASEVKIGDNFWNTYDLQLMGGQRHRTFRLEIGNNCMFSRKITIYTHDGHSIYNTTTKELVNIPKDSLKIGNHVWVGHGVYICKGANIGDNSVVGMGSVVTKSFGEGVIVAGNPAKQIKENINWEK